MAQNFLWCDRDQALLMPPSLRDWLGQDELAWCVLDVVAEMDLAAIYGGYRADGHGRAAFEPGMMVALFGDDGRVVDLRLRGGGALFACD